MDDTPLPAAQALPADSEPVDAQPADPAPDPAPEPAPRPEAESGPANEPIWIALIDADGVLTGFDETGKAAGVTVPVDCDLLPGKYRWDGDSFQPLLDQFSKKQIVAPDAMTAVGRGLLAIRDGKKFDDYTLAWLSAVEKTEGASPSSPKGNN